MAKSILDSFSALDLAQKQILADVNSPLNLALAVLQISSDRFGTDYLTADAIIACLEAAEIAVKQIAVTRALARAGNKVSRKKDVDGIKYRIMLHGRREIESLFSSNSLNVFYVKSGTPHTARKQLNVFLGDLKGSVRICDPYYGAKTLDVLEMLPKECQVLFLTAVTSENEGKLVRMIKDFVVEKPKCEFRKVPRKNDIHDRYIITSNRLMIVGHGIKDIGNKDSFIIELDNNLAPNLVTEITNTFDTKWSSAQPLF